MLDVTTYIDKRLTALANLPANRPRDTLTQALTKSAAFLKALAIKLAPRGKSGRLRGSIKSEVAYPEAYIGPIGIPYAAQREFGGTIHARTVKNLAIPLFEATTANPVWPRDRDDLYFAVSRAGNAILFSKDTGEPMYLLRPSVTQKATPYLTPAAEQGAPVVEKIMGDTVYESLVNP